MDTERDHRDELVLDGLGVAALSAIAEPNRARIVALLGHGEHCGCEVGETLGLSTALVSHHLRVLVGAGLVGERRAGRWVYYSLDAERLAAVRAAVDRLLSPGEAATRTCERSDCGTRRPARRRDPGQRGQAEPARVGA